MLSQAGGQLNQASGQVDQIYGPKDNNSERLFIIIINIKKIDALDIF